MINDALAGKIDLIVTKSVSRFARNTVDSLTTIRKLKDAKIEVYFEKENIWTFDSKGELLLTIMSSLAQEESRSISENITWGQRKRFADGKVSIPYSRVLGFERSPEGNIIVNEEEAKIVRLIFRMALEGQTPYSIAKTLTAQGIKSPGNKDVWNAYTVRRMLCNEKYKGDALLQKTYTTDFLYKKRKVNKGEIPQYYVENNHEAIINPAIFDKVQLIMQSRKPGRNRHSGVHIFSSKIKCGCCGSWYGSKVWHSNDKYKKVIWQCNHKYKNAQKCDTPSLTEEEIKNAFVRAVNRVLHEKGDAIDDFVTIQEPLFDTCALQAERRFLTTEINVLNEEIKNVICENARVAKNQQEYSRRFDALSDTRFSKMARLDTVTAEIKDKTVRLAMIRDFIRAIQEMDGILTEFRNDYWNCLIDYVTVYSKSDIRFTFKDQTEIQA